MTAGHPSHLVDSNSSHPPAQRRVVVTGIGILSPLGNSTQETWSRLLEGKSGISRITRFDSSDLPVQIAGEVKDFDITRPIPAIRPTLGAELTQAANSKEARRMGRFTQYAVVAGLEAYVDSGLDASRDKLNSDRMGVNIGVGMGGLPEIEDVHNEYLAKGFKRITPFFIPQVIANMGSGQLSILLGLRGPNLCNTTACTSSAHSIGEGFKQIQRGIADVLFVGGAESTISPLGIGGFAAMRALSTRNDSPETASRPYDVNRDGFVMGEGAAVLVLEELEHAKKRGAKIYAEVGGYGVSADAYHMTTPAPEGEGGARSMRAALEDAAISVEEIGYVNSHGTSTPAGDAEEARAIAEVFGNARTQVHVSSTKSMTGHLLGAAGAIEGAFCTLAIHHSQIPSTRNIEKLDPACAELGLDFTLQGTVTKKLRAALSNSFGFGGTNATLIFKRWEGM